MKNYLAGLRKEAVEKFILIADDDEDDRFLINDFFSKNGYKCMSLPSGTAAIHVLQLLSPNLYPAVILLDYYMPTINGEEVLTFLKKSERLKDIPVVIYSTEMNEVLRRRLQTLGATECFSKVVQINQLNNLKDKIEKLLSAREFVHSRIKEELN
jgi:CheY-like chemotaxis protein